MWSCFYRVLTHLCCCSCSYCKLPEANDWLFLRSKSHSFWCYYCVLNSEGSDSRITRPSLMLIYYLYLQSTSVSILQFIAILFYLKDISTWKSTYCFHFITSGPTSNESSALWSVLWIICTQYGYFSTQIQHYALHVSFIFKDSTLHQRHLCLYKETVQQILTYFLLWGLSGRPIEDRALLPRLDKSLRSGPRNRSKKESGRSISLCEAQFLSITRNWVSLGDRKMSNRNTSKLFIQYVAFCSTHVKCALNTFKFCWLGWWEVHFFPC